jgi:hypothetical protein
VQRGRVQWIRHCHGVPGVGGTFDYWTIEAGRRESLAAYLDAWVVRHLAGYTGMFNAETIGDRIIEVHLRVADQWPDLYERGWLEAVVGLYRDGSWSLASGERRTGYSLALFGPHGREYRHPPPRLVDEVRRMPHVSSAQITFHEDRAPAAHAMPPGGFRLAVINSTELRAGREARARLAAFWGV